MFSSKPATTISEPSLLLVVHGKYCVLNSMEILAVIEEIVNNSQAYAFHNWCCRIGRFWMKLDTKYGFFFMLCILQVSCVIIDTN